MALLTILATVARINASLLCTIALSLLVSSLFTANCASAHAKTYEFYVHVVRSSFSFSNSTGVLISTVGAGDPSPPSVFGEANVFDDKITEGPEFSTKEVGRVKGVFFQACHNVTAPNCPKILVVSAYDFSAGRLIGSLPVTFLEDLTIPVRSYAFFGGTGDFLGVEGVGIVTPALIADGYLRSHTVLHMHKRG